MHESASVSKIQDSGEERPLPLEDYKRYGRQMILDGFGLQGASNAMGSLLVN